MSLMTRWTKTQEIIAITWIALQTVSFGETSVTTIELSVVNETFSMRVSRSTEAEISFIIETERTSVINLTDVMVTETGWNRSINF
jgi:hypothetical protein